MSFQSRMGLLVISLIEISISILEDSDTETKLIKDPNVCSIAEIKYTFWWKSLKNVSSSQKVVFYKVFEFLCCSLVLNRNKDSVILRLKIDKRNKRPPLALEN